MPVLCAMWGIVHKKKNLQDNVKQVQFPHGFYMNPKLVVSFDLKLFNN